MNYRQDKPRIKTKNILAIFSAVVLTVLIYLVGGFSALGYLLSSSAGSALKISGGAVAGAEESLLAVFSSKKSLLARNSYLEARLDEISAELIGLERIRAENEELKNMLGRSGKKDIVVAAILAKPGQSPYDTLVLDVGEEDGVETGDEVTASGVIFGEISEVGSGTSRVRLFSSFGEEHKATLSGQNISLTLLGQGGGNFSALLPRGVKVENGFEAISGGLYPYTFGTVEGVFADPRDPFQKIILKSPVNFSELRLVEVVK